MKVLIVGLGSIARKHISALLKIDHTTEIFALRSGISTSVDELNVINVFDIEDIRLKNVDFVIISTPTYLHHKNIEQFIAFGKPLFIEKPLADSLDVKKILPVIKANQILTYVGCNLRFLDALNYVKDHYINSDFRINEVNSYAGSYLPEWRKGTDFRQSYSSNSKLGGGAHLDLIHEIDYIYWFFGKPQKTSKVLRNNSSLSIESVDYANYALSYDGFTTSIILNYYRRDAKRSFELLTDRCTVRVDLLQNKVFENEVLVYSSDQKIQDTYEKQLNWFIKNVLTQKGDSFNDIYEAYEVLKISLT